MIQIELIIVIYLKNHKYDKSMLIIKPLKLSLKMKKDLHLLSRKKKTK